MKNTFPQTKAQNKLYRLHQIIKNDFTYNTKKKMVFLPNGFEEHNYSSKVNKALKSLQKLNYSLQTQIN